MSCASKFCEWVQIGINVYIPNCKYQVKPHSSPLVSAASAAAIVHRNQFFWWYQQNKFSESIDRQTADSDRLLIIAKGFLK